MRETRFWTWHMIAGLIILILLGAHMIYSHIGNSTSFMVADKGSDAISKDNSQARDAKPFFPYFLVSMLAVALYHGLYGLNNILCELCTDSKGQKAIGVMLFILGVGLFCLGTFAAFKAHSNAVTAQAKVTLVSGERG